MKTIKLFTIISSLIIMSNPVFASSTDVKIEDAAKASYNYRTVLEGHVKVSSTDGVVTLTGTVSDEDLKRLAESTVNNLPGVIRVDNQIKVESPLPEHSDSWIAFKIHFQLLIRANVSATATTVTVKDGVVTLSGVADSSAQKELTELYAKEVDGVRSINNEMTVKAPPSDSNNSDESNSAGQYVDDASITTQIKYELATHSSTSAIKTSVTTIDGNVVISGDANSSAEVSLVTELAKSIRGVKSVANNMTVKP